MSTKKNYYLFVPADNIYNKQIIGGKITADNKIADQIFERNAIPPKYRKMIFKIPMNGIAEPTEAFELITKKMFYFKTPFLKALLNPLSNAVIEILSHDVGIVTENCVYSGEIIKNFYQEIIDNNLAGNYDNAVREILNMEKEKTQKGIFTRIKKKK